MVGKAGVHGGAAGAHLGAQHVGKLEHQIEVLLRTHAVTAGDDDARALDVDLALRNLAVEDPHRQIGVLHELLPVDLLHLAGARHGGVLAAHDAFADGSHLGTVVGIDDRGDDVAAESGTDLVKQVLILLAGLGVLVVADHQLRAVGRKTAVEGRRYARGEVAAVAGRAEQRDLGVLLFDQAAHDGRMGQRAERCEDLVVGDPDGVGAVFGQFGLDTCKMLAQHYGFELHTQRRGQFAAFGQQFETHVGDLAALVLDIYEYIVHGLLLRI